MSGYRNVYQRRDLVFVGRQHATRLAAENAAADELRAEAPLTTLLAVAEDPFEPAWESELRGLGRLFGVTEPDASAEVIGDSVTSARDTLRAALRNIAHGPAMPPPDPGAHSWRAYAEFWRAESGRVSALARLSLSTETEPK